MVIHDTEALGPPGWLRDAAGVAQAGAEERGWCGRCPCGAMRTGRGSAARVEEGQWKDQRENCWVVR